MSIRLLPVENGDDLHQDPTSLEALSGLLYENTSHLKLLLEHVDTVVRNVTSAPAAAQRLYDTWLASRTVARQSGDLAYECQDVFFAALLHHTTEAKKALNDFECESFLNIKVAVFAILTEFVALGENPMGTTPDFTDCVSTKHFVGSSSTHLASALFFKEGYIKDARRSLGLDMVFAALCNGRSSWFSEERSRPVLVKKKSQRLIESVSYYLVHAGEEWYRQIAASLLNTCSIDNAGKYWTMLRQALRSYRESNETFLMDDKGEGWTLLNLVFRAEKEALRIEKLLTEGE